MNKSLVVLALIGLLVFAGCGQKTTTTQEQKAAPTTATASPEVEEANQQFVPDSSDVQIGEMI